MTKVRKMTGIGTGLLLEGGNLDEVEVFAFLEKSERAVVEGVSIGIS